MSKNFTIYQCFRSSSGFFVIIFPIKGGLSMEQFMKGLYITSVASQFKFSSGVLGPRKVFFLASTSWTTRRPFRRVARRGVVIQCRTMYLPKFNRDDDSIYRLPAMSQYIMLTIRVMGSVQDTANFGNARSVTMTSITYHRNIITSTSVNCRIVRCLLPIFQDHRSRMRYSNIYHLTITIMNANKQIPRDPIRNLFSPNHRFLMLTYVIQLPWGIYRFLRRNSIMVMSDHYHCTVKNRLQFSQAFQASIRPISRTMNSGVIVNFQKGMISMTLRVQVVNFSQTHVTVPLMSMPETSSGYTSPFQHVLRTSFRFS